MWDPQFFVFNTKSLFELRVPNTHFVGKVSESDSVAESTRVVHVDNVLAVEKSSEVEYDPNRKL